MQPLAAHRATSGTRRSKLPIKVFDQLSSPSKVAVRNLITEFKNNLKQGNLPNQIQLLHCMHPQLCRLNNLIHVADGIDLFFKYRRFWTVGKMRRPAPSAISILGLLWNLTKVCQKDNWSFQDGAPFSAYKTD